MVSGRIVRFLVDENDRSSRARCWRKSTRAVSRPGERRAGQARCGEAELKRQEADLARLRIEVPDSDRDCQAQPGDGRQGRRRRRTQALKLTEDEVEKGIEEAAAGVEAAKADLVLAEQEYDRFTSL